jgi:hypothetical protein
MATVPNFSGVPILHKRKLKAYNNGHDKLCNSDCQSIHVRHETAYNFIYV